MLFDEFLSRAWGGRLLLQLSAKLLEILRCYQRDNGTPGQLRSSGSHLRAIHMLIMLVILSHNIIWQSSAMYKKVPTVVTTGI
eukprot:2907863-Amphidinium_carterae.1